MTEAEQAQGKRIDPLTWLSAVLVALTAVVATLAGLLAARKRWRQAGQEPPAPTPIQAEALLDLEGLTEEEAAARRLEGQDNAILFKPPRSREEIIRSNTYTIFNLSLIGMVVVQVLLQKWLDALISFGMIFLNIGLNVGQELFARRRIQDVERAARAQATVIRESQARSVDPSELVIGDIVVAGPGDPVLVDGIIVGEGQIIVDESMLTGESERQVKAAGDAVYAGSICVTGRAAYEAHQVGDERLIVALTDKTESGKEELTPLEKIIDRILRILLLFVALYSAILLIRYFQLDYVIPVDTANNAASVIFSMAPAGLFFMILLAYAAGTADLAKLGALVHQVRTVESLAQTNVFCFAQGGILTGTSVEMEQAEPIEGQPTWSEARLRQVLGDFARSGSVDNLVTRALVSSFPGSQRLPQEEAPFLSLNGWSAISFEDEDLTGVFVLGDPLIMEPYLMAPPEEEAGEEDGEEEGATPRALARVVSPLGRLFGRQKPVEPEASLLAESDPPPAGLAEGESVDGLVTGETTGTVLEEKEDKPGLLGRMTGRLRHMARRGEESEEDDAAVEQEPKPEGQGLLFAYTPEAVSLRANGGSAKIPQGLVPLCGLTYSEQLQPEAIEAIEELAQIGVDIKVFGSSASGQAEEALQGAGLGKEDDGYCIITARELKSLDPIHWPEATAGHALFYDLSPEQSGQVISVMRQAGQAVAAVGDRVNSLPAMQAANTAIARNTGSQAILSVADIVVLDESPKAMLRVLDKGQRIVNGLLDVLKLYVTQMFYILLLIAVLSLSNHGFPYLSTQGTVIAIASIQLPAIFLSLWAAPGVLPSDNLSWLLTRFVAPASITMAIAGVAVYVQFDQGVGDNEYAQIALMHSLVFMGLSLSVFLKPPGRAWLTGGVGKGDWRMVAVCLALLIVFLVVTRIPLAQNLLYVAPMKSIEDYAFVGAVTAVWAAVLWLIWRLVPAKLGK